MTTIEKASVAVSRLAAEGRLHELCAAGSTSQLNLSHYVSKINLFIAPNLLWLTLEVDECKPLVRGGGGRAAHGGRDRARRGAGVPPH